MDVLELIALSILTLSVELEGFGYSVRLIVTDLLSHLFLVV